jgi:hypothetical protein
MRLVQTSLGNGRTETRTYRADDTLSAITVPAVHTLGYGYDANKHSHRRCSLHRYSGIHFVFLTYVARQTMRSIDTGPTSNMELRSRWRRAHLGQAHWDDYVEFAIRNIKERPGDPMFRSAYGVPSPSAPSTQRRRIGRAWLAAVRKQESVPILWNASVFFRDEDPSTAIRLARRAAVQNEKDPELQLLLARLYHARSREKDHRRAEIRRRTSRHVRNACRLLQKRYGEVNLYVASECSSIALEAGDIQQARRLALLVLARFSNWWRTKQLPSDLAHDAHVGLGLIALARADRKTALLHLDGAGKVKGAWSSASGPDVRLADALLRLGERERVAAYLRRCATVWSAKKDALLRSSKAIAAGESLSFIDLHVS